MDLYHHSNPAFTKWVTAAGLLAEKFVVIDVGVQGGEHPRWQFLGPYVEIHGFDPIIEVIDQLRSRKEARRHYHNLALGNEDGDRLFFVSSDRFASSFYRDENTEDERIVPIRRLDSLFDAGLVPEADYIKLDCEGFEPEILNGAARYLTSSEVVCLTSETNFHVSPGLPRTHFAAINDVVIGHRLLVYDMNIVRSPAPAYTAALSGAGRKPPPSPLALGRPGTCDVVFCRDFVSEAAEPDHFRRDGELPRPPSVDKIIKSMINFELHGLMDCAVELAATFRDLLAGRLDVDKAVRLLLKPAPHPRNTADVTLSLAGQAAALNRQQEAEREAAGARIGELERVRQAEREAAVARIRQLEAEQVKLRAAGPVRAALRALVLRYRFLYRLNAWRKRMLGQPEPRA
jgi:FkbM family methyltransferase